MVQALGLLLGFAWLLLPPLALLYGQWWSCYNILLSPDLGWVAKVVQTLAFDAATCALALLWLATLPSSTD